MDLFTVNTSLLFQKRDDKSVFEIMNKRHIYSFDVFDTCLTRAFSNFGDVFLEAAEKILVKRMITPSKEERFCLAALRLNAEKDARIYATAEDITLETIYEFFPKINRFDVSPEEMMAAELLEEHSCIRPVPEIRERIQKLRASGNKIIFISDMYLPTEFIRAELEKYDFSAPQDNIYVSGEIGQTKHSGRLFKFVCQKEEIGPRQLIHTGDNHHTDLEVCKSLGIQTTPYINARQDRWERLAISHNPERSIEMSRVAGAIRIARLESESRGCDRQLSEIAAGVVAPVLTAFTAWTLANAVENGIKRLYFLSRDAKVLLQIAKVIGIRRKIPDCRYLYGSRQAWFLPSTETATEAVDKSELAWLIVQGHSRRPIDLLRKLNLKPYDLNGPASRLGIKADFWETPLTFSAERLWWELVRQPESASLIQGKIRAARSLTISYLSQSGLTSLDSVAVVDVGWTLKIQRSLINLLSHAGWDGPCLGYYLGVAAVAVDTSPIPEYRAFFQEYPRHLDQEQRHNYFFRNANLIEQLFMGNSEGTVLGYRRRNGQVEPVFAQRESNPEKIRFFEAIESAATTFARTCPDSFLHWPKRRLLRFAEAHLEEFICRSGKALAKRVSNYSVADDQLESRKRPLAMPINIAHFLHALIGRVCGINGGTGYKRSFDWIEGSVALSNPIIKKLMKTNAGFEIIRNYRKSL